MIGSSERSLITNIMMKTNEGICHVKFVSGLGSTHLTHRNPYQLSGDVELLKVRAGNCLRIRVVDVTKEKKKKTILIGDQLCKNPSNRLSFKLYILQNMNQFRHVLKNNLAINSTIKLFKHRNSSKLGKTVCTTLLVLYLQSRIVERYLSFLSGFFLF